MSRRNFLKLSAATAAAVGIKGLELNNVIKGVVGEDKKLGEVAKDSVVDILNDPEKTKTFLMGAKRLLLKQAEFMALNEGIKLSPNPDYMPMLQLITTGIDLSGERCYFDADDANIARDNEVVLPGIIRTLADIDASGVHGHDMLLYLVNPEKDSSLMDQSVGYFASLSFDRINRQTKLSPYFAHAGEIITSLADIPTFYPGSGIVNRAKEKIDITNSLQVRQYVSMEIATPYNALLNVSRKRGVPLSTVHLFAYFLQRAQGNIRQAADDMEITLKIWARNDMVTGETLEMIRQKNLEEVSNRFKIFQDQYSLIGRDFGRDAGAKLGSWDYWENEDLSHINRLGSPYHVWGIVNKLSTSATQLIRTITMGVMLPTVNRDQGRLKTAVDFSALLELDEINDYLRKLPVNK